MAAEVDGRLPQRERIVESRCAVPRCSEDVRFGACGEAGNGAGESFDKGALGCAGIKLGVNGKILETARVRVGKAGWTNVEFVAGDARTLDLGGDFDALVGRFVLMYMSDPSEALKQFAGRLRPGGIVAFQEIDFTFRRSFHPPNTPLAKKLIGWAIAVFECSGVHTGMGFDLYRAFVDAGLPEPVLEGTVLGGGSAGWPGYEYIAASVQSVLPLMEEYGIATSEEVDVKTLPERLRKEVVAAKSPILLPMNITAWTRLTMDSA